MLEDYPFSIATISPRGLICVPHLLLLCCVLISWLDWSCYNEAPVYWLFGLFSSQWWGNWTLFLIIPFPCLSIHSLVSPSIPLPFSPEFILGSVKLYLLFLSFLYTEMAQVAEIISHWKTRTCLSHTVNRPISEIPQCIGQIYHNAPFCNRNVHTCEHYGYKMMHCEIWDWCIVGFAQQDFTIAVDGLAARSRHPIHPLHPIQIMGCNCLSKGCYDLHGPHALW